MTTKVIEKALGKTAVRVLILESGDETFVQSQVQGIKLAPKRKPNLNRLTNAKLDSLRMQ